MNRVVITGLGAVSPLGADVQSLWNGLLEGRSGIRRLERFSKSGLAVTAGGEVESVPVGTENRDEVIARAAIDQALDQSGLDAQHAGFVWSTGLDSYQIGDQGLFWNSSGGCFHRLSKRFHGPKRMIAMACASGTAAIGEGFRLIRSERIDACVVGGSSTMLTMFYILGFGGLQALAFDTNGADPATCCRPFDKNRRGFVLADGAGALVLESHVSALRRGALILAEVKGYGVSQDAYDLNRPTEDGSGAELCLRRTVGDANLRPGDIHAVNAHGTGTYVGDLAEASALRRLFGSSWSEKPVSSVKGSIGHTQAAAGALEAIVAIQTCRTGLVPHTVNLEEPGQGCELDHIMNKPFQIEGPTVLSSSFGMGGQNAAVVFQRFSP